LGELHGQRPANPAGSARDKDAPPGQLSPHENTPTQ
jgi:hypothetical protein